MIRSTTRALFRCALSCALALASIALCFSSARAATLAMEAVYDPTNGNISVRPYDSDTDTPWTGADPVFGLFDINSSNGLFSGDPANLPTGSFVSGDTDTRINFAFISGAPTISDASPWDLGNVAAVGLTDAQLDNMISTETGAGPATFTWSLGAGNPNQIGRVVSAQPVPEPSTIVTLAIGGIAGLGFTARRRLRKRAANASATRALAA